MRPCIGNDIVDLAEPGVAGKARDGRFMDRVFTPAERGRILAAPSPTVALWKTWAAKETAFKIASKLREGLVFAHREFEVGPEPGTAPARQPAPGGLAGWASVWFDDLHVRVRWDAARDYIHCVGQLVCGETPGGDGADLPRLARRLLDAVLHDGHALDGRLTRAERASVHSTPSARARLLARRLLDRWDVQGAEIVRLWRSRGWSPPLVSRDGRLVDGFDVSLSHDGRFIAAAVAGPA